MVSRGGLATTPADDVRLSRLLPEGMGLAWPAPGYIVANAEVEPISSAPVGGVQLIPGKGALVSDNIVKVKGTETVEQRSLFAVD